MGPVETVSEIRFEDCRFDASVAGGGSDGLLSLSFQRCLLRAGAQLQPGGECVFDSCEVEGGISVNWFDARLRVMRSTIRGGGAGAGIGAGRPIMSLAVSDTRIQGFTVGIIVEAEHSAVILGNTIEDCRWGILVENTDDVRIEGNVVRRCGTGIRSEGRSQEVTGNRVLDGSGVGLFAIFDGALTVADNVVARCGGDGISIAGYAAGTGRVHHNTTCFNAGAGLASEVWSDFPSTSFQIDRNIGFGNGGYGLDWRVPAVGTVTCNDWFGNQLGAVGGGTLSPGDFVLDPLFCDASGGDFHPSPVSPLVTQPGCGLIGALGVGCAVTATLVERFVAERTAEGVRLRWRVPSLPPDDVSLDRAEHDAGAWSNVATERAMDGEGVSDLDRTALPERAYWYRLVTRGRDGRETQLAAPIEVAARDEAGFRIVRISPIPAGGPIHIEFALPRAAEVAVSLFDVQGRSVATLTQGVRPAGRHTLEWSARLSGRSAPAGIYLVRYRFPGGQVDRRLVLAP